MGSGAWTTAAQSSATSMFTANFKANGFGTSDLTSSFTESAGNVVGTATVKIPMTLMRVFGQIETTTTVNCTGQQRIPNSDVMFVLDTTGSMNCKVASAGYTCPNGSNNGTEDANAKIKGIRQATKCFYEALAKVDIDDVTPAECGTSANPSGGNGGSVQLRFGFVPYASMVNVGKLLPNTHLVDNWNYQSREWNVGTPVWGPKWQSHNNSKNPNDNTTNAPNDQSYNTEVKMTLAQCTTYLQGGTVNGTNYPGSNPYFESATGYTYTYSNADGGNTARDGIEWGWTGAQVSTGTTRSCRRWRAVTSGTSAWKYKQKSFNVSGLKAGGSTWNSSVSLPLGINGANTSITWDGCIEERDTFKNTDGTVSDDWATIPSAAKDLDIDAIPSGTDQTTQWRPALYGAVFERYTSSALSTRTQSESSFGQAAAYYTCPTAASKMADMSPANFKSYVNGLVANGGTYHDIGLIWGARLISSTGLFASENAATSTGRSIERHIVFMTDGDTSTSLSTYTSQGMDWWDRRQTTAEPTDAVLSDLVNARVVALCNAIKNKNITLWVVSYGGGVNSTTETRLQNCATDNAHFFSASNTATLINNFKQIAAEISELRLTN
jgi:hypothetical protein